MQSLWAGTHLKLIGQTIADAQKRTSSLSSDFFVFVRRLTGLDYSGGYAYLKLPLERMTQGRDVDFCKGSQIGATEAVLGYSFFSLVQRQKSIFYMLPTESDCADFSSARFNVLVDANEEIRRTFNADNVHHKRYKKANIYIRGAQNNVRSRSKIKSVPVEILIEDELDEISESSQEEVEERLSGSASKQRIRVSTPTLSDRGIWKCWQKDAQHIYLLKCNQCHTEQPLTLDDNADIENRCYRCKRCKAEWTHQEKIAMVTRGRWEKTCEGETEGFAVSQLYSPTVTAKELITKMVEADTEIKKQIFYNHKLGLPYASEGSRLTEDKITARLRDFNAVGLPLVAGIDVSQGGLHYVVIAAWHDIGPVVVKIARVPWESLASYLKTFGVQYAVIDKRPETKKAREFVDEFGPGLMALYPNMRGFYQADEDQKTVNINRTEVIDTVLDRFRKDTICLLQTLISDPNFDDFRSHLCSVSRLYRDSRGEPEAYYLESGPDHFLHALCYCEIAGQIGGQQVFDSLPERVIR